MERESFENEISAGFLNEHFVSVRVYREERSDVDKIYATFAQATTGPGGLAADCFSHAGTEGRAGIFAAEPAEVLFALCQTVERRGCNSHGAAHLPTPGRRRHSRSTPRRLCPRPGGRRNTSGGSNANQRARFWRLRKNRERDSPVRIIRRFAGWTLEERMLPATSFFSSRPHRLPPLG